MHRLQNSAIEFLALLPILVSKLPMGSMIPANAPKDQATEPRGGVI